MAAFLTPCLCLVGGISELHAYKNKVICVCVSKAYGLKLVLSLALLRGGRNLEEVRLTGHSSDHWA